MKGANNLLRLILEQIEATLGLPSFVRRSISETPEFRMEFHEPMKVVSAERVIHWHHWMEDWRSADKVAQCWSMANPYSPRSYRSEELAFRSFVNCDITEQWQCDICDVEGLAASKSSIDKYHTLDDFARECCSGLIEDISENKLKELLNHREIRIIHNPNTSDCFIRHQWDGRIFLCNSGGSHHFAAARYLAKKLNRTVPLKGTLYGYRLNKQAIDLLRSKYDLFIMNESHVYGRYFEMMAKFRASFCTYWIPRPFCGIRLVMLPKNDKRSRHVSFVMQAMGFFDMGNYLIELTRR